MDDIIIGSLVNSRHPFMDQRNYSTITPVSTPTPFYQGFQLSNMINNQCQNHYLGHCWLIYIIVVVNICLSIVTTLGNVLVVLAFHLDSHIRHPSNLFICSLGVSDCLIGIVSMPFFTAYVLYNQRWPLGNFLCSLWLSLDYSLCLTSIYNVFFITVDRYCSVKYPAKYNRYRTKTKVLIVIYSSWAISVLIFFSSTFAYPFFSKSGKKNFDPVTGVCDVQWKENKLINVPLTIGYFWVTLGVMVGLYISIYRVAKNLERRSERNAKLVCSLVGVTQRIMESTVSGLNNIDGATECDDHCDEESLSDSTKDQYHACTGSRHHSRATVTSARLGRLFTCVKTTRVNGNKHESASPKDGQRDNCDKTNRKTTASAHVKRLDMGIKSKRCKRARKSLRTITFILGAFVICWTPWHIYAIILNFCKSCQDSRVLNHFYLFFYYMCYVNSPINPFCYALANQQFRRAFYRILKLDFRRV